MRALCGLALVLAAVIAAPRHLPAQQYRDIVLRQLDAAARSVSEHGFRPDQSAVSRDQIIGVLPSGSMAMIELSLVGGGTYFIAGVCDQDCNDLDLELYGGANNDSITKDVETDDVPMLNFTAPSTGNYMLAVRMASCETKNCYFGLRVYRK